MLNLMVKLQGMFRNEKGQGMVEYGLILGFVALAAFGTLSLLGPKVAGFFIAITADLP
jgi:pilus assembly protein Flp/PilA